MTRWSTATDVKSNQLSRIGRKISPKAKQPSHAYYLVVVITKKFVDDAERMSVTTYREQMQVPALTWQGVFGNYSEYLALVSLVAGEEVSGGEGLG